MDAFVSADLAIESHGGPTPHDHGPLERSKHVELASLALPRVGEQGLEKRCGASQVSGDVHSILPSLGYAQVARQGGRYGTTCGGGTLTVLGAISFGLV